MTRAAAAGRHRAAPRSGSGRLAGRGRSTTPPRPPGSRVAGAHRAGPSPRLVGTAAATALVAGSALVGTALSPVAAGAAPGVAVGQPSNALADDVSAASGPWTSGSADGAGASAPGPVLGSVAASGSTGSVRGSAVEPVALSIPAIGVQADLTELGVQVDGSLEVPADVAQAGWFTGGATPGSPGPAVVAGHVDSVEGPGVFVDLEDVATGDEVVVDRQDGTQLEFVVTRALRAPKDEFPTDQVYGPTAASELRLITCAGPFDRGTGHYEDNLVVFARLVV